MADGSVRHRSPSLGPVLVGAGRSPAANRSSWCPNRSARGAAPSPLCGVVSKPVLFSVYRGRLFPGDSLHGGESGQMCRPSLPTWIGAMTSPQLP